LPDHHETAGDNVDVALARAIPSAHLVAVEKARPSQLPQPARENDKIQQSGKAAAGGLYAAVRVEHPAAHDPDVRIGAHIGDGSGEDVPVHDRVRVQQQHEASTRYHQRLVVGGCKSAILRIADQYRFRKLAFDHGDGAVVGAVVDDNHLGI